MDIDVDVEFISTSILFENEEVLITKIIQFTFPPLYSILFKISGEIFDFTQDEIENLLKKDDPITSYNDSESESDEIYSIDDEFLPKNILFENEFIIISNLIVLVSPTRY